MKLAFTRRPVGAAVSRPNGYVSLTAGETRGTLITKPLRSSGPMAINASTGPDGWSQIDLVSPEGVSLRGFSKKFQGDGLRAPVFEKLPSAPFKIKGTLKAARGGFHPSLNPAKVTFIHQNAPINFDGRDCDSRFAGLQPL